MIAGRKLLLADDSAAIQKVIELTFADEGMQVFSVGNGRLALEALEQVAPDVVLADVFMPELNGYDLCRSIKQNERFAHWMPPSSKSNVRVTRPIADALFETFFGGFARVVPV